MKNFVFNFALIKKGKNKMSEESNFDKNYIHYGIKKQKKKITVKKKWKAIIKITGVKIRCKEQNTQRQKKKCQ